MNLVEATLAGSQVTLSSTFAGPAQFDLTGIASGPASPLMKWLKPSIVFTRGGFEVYRFEPYGPPSPPDWGTWFVVGLLALMVVLLVRGR